MADLLARLHAHPIGAPVARALGLPRATPLTRLTGADVALPLGGRRILFAGAGPALAHLRAAAVGAGAREVDASASAIDIVLLDASGASWPADARLLYDSLHPVLRRLRPNGRVLIAAADPGASADPLAAGMAQAADGFMRALAKELGGRGITVNLLVLGSGALARLEAPLRFFCSARSAYVSGQALRLSGQVPAAASAPMPQPLAGKLALVTGAARGIGLAIVERLIEEGARVIALDVPAAQGDLAALQRRSGAVPLPLDLHAADAAAHIGAFVQGEGSAVDIVVHNAGITRDRTLANMAQEDWERVLAVNFGAVAAIDAHLLGSRLLRDEGRIVCLSSLSAIAGNPGQTAYAASKAALIGYVRAQAPLLAPRGICINALAPGFIDTAMTAAMPWLPRELGRRLNALHQGGQARDVADAVAFLAAPGASGVSGATLRVCGQNLLGA